MNELSRDNKLYAIVMDHIGNATDCALERVYQKLGITEGDLLEAGSRLGFSPAESWGVMVGWDTARGYKIISSCITECERFKDPEAFDRGVAVGKRCAELA